MTRRWNQAGIDGRAIYAALAMFHTYFYYRGLPKVGANHLSALETEANKLAEAMLKRDKIPYLKSQ